MTILELSIDDEIAGRARQLAASRGQSLEAEIMRFVQDMADLEARQGNDARRTLARLFEQSPLTVDGPVAAMEREEIYAERVSRYEHSGLRGDRQDR